MSLETETESGVWETVWHEHHEDNHEVYIDTTYSSTGYEYNKLYMNIDVDYFQHFLKPLYKQEASEFSVVFRLAYHDYSGNVIMSDQFTVYLSGPEIDCSSAYPDNVKRYLSSYTVTFATEDDVQEVEFATMSSDVEDGAEFCAAAYSLEAN
jgi:hypothetical protein